MSELNDRNFLRGWAWRYALALLAVTAAAALRLALPDTLGPSSYLAFYPAVVAAAAFGGTGPGLLATLLATLGVNLFFDATPGSLDYGSSAVLLRQVIFAVGGVGISIVAGMQRAARHRQAQVQQKLRESEARYRTLFNSIDEGFCIIEVIFDPGGAPIDLRFLQVNPAFEQHQGLIGAVGKTIRELVPDIEPHWMQRYGEVAQTGQAVRFVEQSEALHRWFDLYAFRVGKPDQHRVAVLFTDITQRRATEEALRRSEAQFRTLVTASSQVLYRMSPDWSEMRQLRGGGFLADTEAPNRNWLQEYIHPEDQPRVWATITDAIGAKSVFELEHRVLRPDGTLGWTFSRAVPMFDDGGNITEWFGAASDITPRKQAEEAMAAAKLSAERARAAAEQASLAKDHFLAVLSHELRTPLAPVLATASLLQRDARLDADIREHLEVIRRNAELEARLIDDLLDVTRIARGKVELNRHPTELCTILRHAVDVCRPDIDARHLHFGLQIKEPPHIVHADPGRLQQVFWNLIKNAVKFTPHEGCVGVRCWREDGQVLVEVSDSGVGIEPEALTRVFNAFEQEQRANAGQFGGLGLGLAISKAMVELHEGSIQAQSPGRNRGSTFTVRLPVAPRVAPRSSAQAPVPSSADSRRSKCTGHCRVLLVEDHGDTARIMTRLLTERGHEVHAAGDVSTALDLAEKHQFDLLLSDLGLPDGSGLELIQTLRQRGHNFPAVALSGYGQDLDVRRSLAAGFDRHLTKPVDLDRLHQTIAALTSPETQPARVPSGL